MVVGLPFTFHLLFIFIFISPGTPPTHTHRPHTYRDTRPRRQNGNKNISLQILFSFISPFLFVFVSELCVCICISPGETGPLLALLYLFSFSLFFIHFPASRRRRKPLLYVCSVSFRLPGTYPASWVLSLGYPASRILLVLSPAGGSCRMPSCLQQEARPCSPCDLFLKAAQLWLKQLSVGCLC